MNNELPVSNKQITSFVDLLKNNLPEHRDNRGKRHTLVSVIVGFVSATLIGRQKLSSVHRYICNRADWLYEITQTKKVKPISRAHLPRFLNGLDWLALNELIERCFGIQIHYSQSKKWIAIDGKALRGTLDAGDKQNIILAVDHDTREVLAQARQCGDKSSEIPVVRELLKGSCLEKQKVSLDAHHFNPMTTAQIHQAKGIYLTQVKENQAIFLKQCKLLSTQFTPLAETKSHEKAHGRVTTRRAQLFSLDSLSLDSRWKSSGLSALIVMERETVEIAKQKTTFDTSYYVSNSEIEPSSIKALTKEVACAIRCHWGVESNNWIRDVTFNEDHIKTKAGNQAQIMALLRGLAIELIRKTSPKNFQAAIENLSDSIANLESMLRQVKFL
ncbi:MAG: ISAs1 family transposase [Methyloprofundus sp.]|nr:ISAs1 family transposase [Methyloprofundus sp.]